MSLIHGNENNFKELISEDIVLVDFAASWCGPCQRLTPVLEDLANDRKGIKVVKIDVDECEQLAMSFGVMSVPTLILFNNGREVSKKTGFMPKDMLIEWIDENI